MMFNRNTKIVCGVTLLFVFLRMINNFRFLSIFNFQNDLVLILLSNYIGIIGVTVIGVLLVLVMVDVFNVKWLYLYFGIGVFSQVLFIVAGFVYEFINVRDIISFVLVFITLVPLFAIYFWDQYQYKNAMTFFYIHIGLTVLNSLYLMIVGFGIMGSLVNHAAIILIDIVLLLMLRDIKDSDLVVGDKITMIDEIEYEDSF